MSVPIFSRSANGYIVDPYSRAQLNKMTKPKREKYPEIPTMIVPNLPPPIRGDLERISQYNALNEAYEKYEKTQYQGKAKNTDELMRAFLTQQIDNETARRRQIEMESDMPYAGVVADMIQKKRQVDQIVGGDSDELERRRRIAEAVKAENEALAAQAQAERAVSAMVTQRERTEMKRRQAEARAERASAAASATAPAPAPKGIAEIMREQAAAAAAETPSAAAGGTNLDFLGAVRSPAAAAQRRPIPKAGGGGGGGSPAAEAAAAAPGGDVMTALVQTALGGAGGGGATDSPPVPRLRRKPATTKP